MISVIVDLFTFLLVILVDMNTEGIESEKLIFFMDYKFSNEAIFVNEILFRHLLRTNNKFNWVATSLLDAYLYYKILDNIILSCYIFVLGMVLNIYIEKWDSVLIPILVRILFMFDTQSFTKMIIYYSQRSYLIHMY